MAQKIKKGDRVEVLVGRNRGQRGDILRILPDTGKAIVQGVNLAMRHTRQSQTSQGGIISKEMPLNLSNLSLIDPADDKPVRVGFKTDEDGRKRRYAKRSGQFIDS